MHLFKTPFLAWSPKVASPSPQVLNPQSSEEFLLETFSLQDDPPESRTDERDSRAEGMEKSRASLRSYLSPDSHDTARNQHRASVFVNIDLAPRVLSHGNS